MTDTIVNMHQKVLGRDAKMSTQQKEQVPSKLSTATITNIVILSVVGFTSALILLFGQFEGKTARVISTLVAFALFTLFTTWGAKKRSERQAQLSIVGNIYFLGISLVLIWGSLLSSTTPDPYDYDYMEEGIVVFLSVLLLAAIVKVGSIIMTILSRPIGSEHSQVNSSATLSSVLFGITLVLLTLPIGLYSVIDFSEFYWRIMVAVLILAALFISIEAVIFHSFKDKEPNATVEASADDANTSNSNKTTEATEDPENSIQAPVEAKSAGTDGSAVKKEQPKQINNEPTQYSAPIAPTAPWPVFPNGLPLPAKPNGRPDYHALQYMASIYVESEKQWFNN